MNVKDKKGSITVFVLVGLLFMSSFLILSYANNVNKSKIAREQFEIINNIYQYSNQALEDAINNVRKPIEVGDYVEYDVSYQDMYQGTTFTSTNGWRYLGEEAGTGNKLLISTGIPMILDYSYDASGENAKWWDMTKTNANEKATLGMTKNFDKIPYAQKSSGEKNTAIGRFEPSVRTYEGAEYNAVGNYFKVTGKTYSNNIIVRTLTLAELNRAVNSAMEGESGYIERTDTDTTDGFKDIPEGNAAYGLFDMQDLTEYTAKYGYWLASLYGSSSLYHVIYNEGLNLFCVVATSSNFSSGVRPVVVLPSDVQFTDTNGDEVYEIR